MGAGRAAAHQACWTVMRFWVSVPVLSEATTVVLPRFSTLGMPCSVGGGLVWRDCEVRYPVLCYAVLCCAD
jgi:hypothetical protein